MTNDLVKYLLFTRNVLFIVAIFSAGLFVCMLDSEDLLLAISGLLIDALYLALVYIIESYLINKLDYEFDDIDDDNSNMLGVIFYH